jgi:hypothetical protein
MKIEPKQVILEGLGPRAADHLVAISEFDNLVDSATFRASLRDADGVELVWVHVKLDASNYASWDASAVGAHRICAAVIGVTLIE